MPERSDRDPSSLAQGVQWATRTTTIALEMVLPALLGYWLDQRWGTEPWLVVAGAVLGFAVAMLHLLRLASSLDNGQSPPQTRKPPTP